MAWAKHKAGVTQPTGQWTEEERTRVCQHLAGVINHVRLLLIGMFCYILYCKLQSATIYKTKNSDTIFVFFKFFIR